MIDQVDDSAHRPQEGPTRLEHATQSVKALISVVSAQVREWDSLAPKYGQPRHTALRLVCRAIDLAQIALFSAEREDTAATLSLMRPIFELYSNFLFVSLPGSSRQKAHHNVFRIHGLIELHRLLKRFTPQNQGDAAPNELQNIERQAEQYANSLLRTKLSYLRKQNLTCQGPFKLAKEIHDEYKRIRYEYLTSAEAQQDERAFATRKRRLVLNGNLSGPRSFLERIVSAPRGSETGSLFHLTSSFLHPGYGTLVLEFPHSKEILTTFLKSLSTILYVIAICSHRRFFFKQSFPEAEMEKAYIQCRSPM